MGCNESFVLVIFALFCIDACRRFFAPPLPVLDEVKNRKLDFHVVPSQSEISAVEKCALKIFVIV